MVAMRTQAEIISDVLAHQRQREAMGEAKWRAHIAQWQRQELANCNPEPEDPRDAALILAATRHRRTLRPQVNKPRGD